MWCTKCNNPLSQCICPDLKERLAKLAECTSLFIPKEQMERYEKQAENNETQKEIAE